MSILQTTDFTGFHKLAGSIENDTLLQSYIDKYEKSYINKVFGIALGKLIVADILANDGIVPLDPNYLKVWNSFEEVGDDDAQYVSEGMSEILKSCIFWHYIVETTTQHTQAGVTGPGIDTQARAASGRYAENRWNNMLSSWEAIQCFISENDTDYPDYVYLRKPDPCFEGLL